MSSTPAINDFLVVGLGGSLDLYAAVLQGLNEQQYVGIDIEDVLSVAVFQLNQRERPLVVDHLLQNSHSPSHDLQIVDMLATNLYRHLDSIVPACFQVTFFDYLDTDLLLGVTPLE